MIVDFKGGAGLKGVMALFQGGPKTMEDTMDKWS